MTQEEKTQIEERIVDVLKTVYDPEIPVNIYDRRLYIRRCTHEGGERRGREVNEREPRLRAGLGPVDDERRSKSGIRIRLKVKK